MKLRPRPKRTAVLRFGESEPQAATDKQLATCMSHLGRRRSHYKVAAASPARLPYLLRPCHASRQRSIDCEDNNRQGYHCRNHNRRRNPSVHWRSPSIVKGGARQRLSAANAQESLLAV